jgi:hypothetical protein
VQHARTTRAVKVDDGWQLGRDISVQTGRWTWLDLRVLIEDHGSGKGLARVSTRVRLAPYGLPAIFMILGATISALALILAPYSMGSYVSLAMVLLVGLRWMKRTVTAIIATDRCVIEGLAGRQMHPIVSREEDPAGNELVRTPVKKTSL